MKQILAECVRQTCLIIYWTGNPHSLISMRVEATEIGLTGYVTDFDRGVAERYGFKPLNRFEKWLLKPYIEAEQKRRREAFRQSVLEVTGEDLDDDW